MKKVLKVLVLFDSAGPPPADQNFTEQLKTKEWSTEASVINALKKLGHKIKLLGVYDDLSLIVNEIKSNQYDVVFNLTEVFLGKAYFDKNVVSILEMLKIPFTGSGSVALMLCNNKAVSKKILTFHKIKVPHFQVFYRGKKVWKLKKLKYPLIMKPLTEEASTGISQASFIDNDSNFQERIRFIHEHLKMDAIAEEYIEGRELYVSILGNKRLKMLPLREMKFGHIPDDEPKIATFKAKWDEKYRTRWGIKNDFAEDISEPIKEKIFNICKKAFKVLYLQGYGRFDIRLTRDSEVFILEANANPSLAPDDEVAMASKKMGISYEQLTDTLIRYAFTKKDY